MAMRIAKIGEQQLIQSIIHSVWGSNRFMLKWEKDDLLVLKVNNELAAIAKITGIPDVSLERVWDNGLFPYRIPINFTHAFLPGNRIAFDGKIKEAFNKAYGKNYGSVILNKTPLKQEIVDLICAEIEKHRNDITEITETAK